MSKNELKRYVTGAKLLGRDTCAKYNEYAIEVTLSDESQYIVYRSLKDIANFHVKLVNQFRTEIGGFKSQKKDICDCPIKKTPFGIRRAVNDDRIFERQLYTYIKSLSKLPENIVKSETVDFFLSLQSSDLQIITKKLNKQPKSAPDLIRVISQPISLKQYLCINDYKSKGGDNFSLKSGAIVQVIQKDFTGWWLVDSLGIQGWAPASYLVPVDEFEEEDSDFVLGNDTGGTRYISMSAYKASRDDELSFVKGAVVKTIKRHADGWWLVRYNGKEGYVPGTLFKKFDRRQATAYIKQIQRKFSVESNVSVPPTTRLKTRRRLIVEKSSNKRASTMYECMDDFIGVNQYELRLSKGDNVRVLSKNQNGLWYVLDSKGKAGWVPGDNLKLMAKSDQTESLVDSSRISDTVVCPANHKVMVDYTGKQNNELTVTRGEEVSVIHTSDNDWLMVSKVSNPQQQGLVPSTCLEPTDDDKCDELLDDEDCCEIARDYVGTSIDELTVYKGQTANIIDNTDEEQWYVNVEGKEGWLPANLFHPFHDNNNEELEEISVKDFVEASPAQNAFEKSTCDAVNEGSTTANDDKSNKEIPMTKHWISVDYNSNSDNSDEEGSEVSSAVQFLVTSSLIDVDSLGSVDDIEVAAARAEKLAKEAQERADALRKLVSNMRKQT